jgi:hypothetical protein
MPRLTGVLRAEGALVAVEIGQSRSEVQRLRKAARPIPAPVSLHALLDTGAECSCAGPQAVAILSLPLANIGMVNIPALGGLTPTTQHESCLTVLHPSGDPERNLVVDGLLLAEALLAALGYEVLIGRDVLSKCRFVYDGPGERFKLSY